LFVFLFLVLGLEAYEEISKDSHDSQPEKRCEVETHVVLTHLPARDTKDVVGPEGGEERQ
jgi:hypothetical protein